MNKQKKNEEKGKPTREKEEGSKKEKKTILDYLIRRYRAGSEGSIFTSSKRREKKK